ncbi:hypothetical protein LX32DRAFT_387953 [Colletotrichum zoysiae]|uniref:Chitin synthesis regulation, Congo red resistance, RCR protein n=1 Tax=Colletotrichum zoysiae TaxID=1216348 RepID=A0AAD9HH09_9PEZI|nr:hypothetical protein LX32DRAFT_387953 [Colletotrichum zoysiae]
MAAFEFPQALEKREYPCRSGQIYRNGLCYERGAWYWWGRWVLAAVVAGLTLLMLVLCMNNRRRRRRGVQPMYGFGWMGGNNKQNQHTYAYNQQYNGQQQGYAGYPQPGADGSYPAPPPAYGQAQQNPQYTGTTFNPNDGYYGAHNEGIQLQQPQNSYQRDVYSPPAGPPPGK